MNRTTALFKIGGKILGELESLKSTFSQLKHLFDENLIQKIIIIPGGGTFANFNRKVYSELKFTEEIAHFMGIISMNYNGLELGKIFPDLEVIEREATSKKTELHIEIIYRFHQNFSIALGAGYTGEILYGNRGKFQLPSTNDISGYFSYSPDLKVVVFPLYLTSAFSFTLNILSFLCGSSNLRSGYL